MKKEFKNVKSIEFDVKFEGNGCVNFDGNEQAWALQSCGLYTGKINKNIKLAKRVISRDENGNYQYQFKVSSECLRHNMFKDEMAFVNPSISFLPQVLLRTIATPAYHERGFMFPNTCNSIRKKSGATITGAIGETVYDKPIVMELHSSSGKKGENQSKDNTLTSDDKKDDAKDTTLYFKENVGVEKYNSQGFIDLTELQFIPADNAYERNAVGIPEGSQFEKIYLTVLSENYGEDYNFDYYYMKDASTRDEWAERGIRFSEKSVDFLVKDILRRVFEINITTADAIFKFESIKVKVHTLDCPEGEEIELNSVNDLDNYFFGYFEKYIKASDEKIIANRKEYEDTKEKAIQDRRAKKNTKTE